MSKARKNRGTPVGLYVGASSINAPSRFDVSGQDLRHRFQDLRPFVERVVLALDQRSKSKGFAGLLSKGELRESLDSLRDYLRAHFYRDHAPADNLQFLQLELPDNVALSTLWQCVHTDSISKQQLVGACELYLSAPSCKPAVAAESQTVLAQAGVAERTDRGSTVPTLLMKWEQRSQERRRLADKERSEERIAETHYFADPHIESITDPTHGKQLRIRELTDDQTAALKADCNGKTVDVCKRLVIGHCAFTWDGIRWFGAFSDSGVFEDVGIDLDSFKGLPATWIEQAYQTCMRVNPKLRSDAAPAAAMSGDMNREDSDSVQWISLADAEKISGINRGVISKAASAGEIKNNGRKGKGKIKLDSADFNRWHLDRAKRPEQIESEERVKRLLDGKPKKDKRNNG